MNGLYPIVRRVRRPLLPAVGQAAPVVPAASPQAAPPPALVAVPTPSPASEAAEAKPETKRKRR